RFSKFVVEAAHRGIINLNKLDNGQYEIGLGAGVPGAAAQPSLGGSVERPRDRERGGRGGGRRAAEAPAPAGEQRRSGFSLDGAFGLIKQAIGKLGGGSRPVSAEEIGEAMAEIKGDDKTVEPAQVQTVLRQAHGRGMM